MRVAIKELSGILLVQRHRAAGWTKAEGAGAARRDWAAGLNITTAAGPEITQGGDEWIMDMQKGKWDKFSFADGFQHPQAK